MGISPEKSQLASGIIKIFEKQSGVELTPELEVFVCEFVSQLPNDDMERLGHEGVARLSFSLWSLIQNRPPEEAKFRLYKWIPDTESIASERLVLDIVNNNMPFLVDSISGLLESCGLKSHILLHPIFQVQRDEAGQIVEIKAPEAGDKKHSNLSYESVIHCQIREGYSAETMAHLNEVLPQVLADIRNATSDWREMRAKVFEAAKDVEAHVPEPEKCSEISKFLEWVEDHHFTFLGYGEFDFSAVNGEAQTSHVTPETALGIMRGSALQDLMFLLQGVPSFDEAKDYLLSQDPVFINKSSHVSKVHRIVPMDVLGIKSFDKSGKVQKIHMFVGLFTSEAYDSSARDIPLIRQKISRILEKAGLSTDWHDGKAMIHILDSLPRDELFQAPVSELAKVGRSILSIQERPRVAFFVRKDRFNRFLSCLVYVPRDRFDFNLSTQMQSILREEFGCAVSLVKAQFGDFAFARVHYRVDIPPGVNVDFDAKKIEGKLIKAARSWKDGLRALFNLKFDEWTSAKLLHRYGAAFPRAYQERYTESAAQKDIETIDIILSNQETRAQVFRENAEDPCSINLKIFHYGAPLALSDMLPTMENIGLYVVSEVPYTVSPKGAVAPVWIHNFETKFGQEIQLDLETKDRFLELLDKIWKKECEDDSFNALVLRANLTWRECVLIRSYGRYLYQLKTTFNLNHMAQVLATHGTFTNLCVRLFCARFHPQKKNRESEAAQILEKMSAYLQEVENAEEDRILRLYQNVILSTIRTNYYQTLTSGGSKPYLSFKIDCAQIEEMPKPRPMYEIYVNSSTVEGVHLRGGKIARGGLRWSDRYEDFRTEVLGLMKAQVVKNAVIVPTGSKGGFVVKENLLGLDRSEAQEKVVENYRTFVRGLLDLADNMVDGKTIAPANTVCHDDPDQYLVVAADKGTATFSDYANTISEEYGFWLGDAFASGGSAGYDHKKMGITARGAWESVKHHFYLQGVDVQKDPTTVVGVGDMGGDVFGNGMLCSKALKLVGAFNHLHIFIDPDPDPETSYEERKRLFEMPRSSWQDYNSKLISKGGGVFDRSAKSISLTPEMKALLGVDAEVLPPHKLINALLKAQVDLLWFGGIGTYVKGRTQSDADVGDRSNDNLRVNAEELRCKVIGEGANLGVTQIGRIEFARNGGAINTDFIDNSAGVDTSDHEVNLKILLNQEVVKGNLSQKGRNKLLEEMTEEIAELVLWDNKRQNQAITTVSSQGHGLLDIQVRLMEYLEAQGKLDREVENLPDDATLASYQETQQSLSRPEIAVIVSYAKLVLEQQIPETKLVDDPYFEDMLFAYFPKKIQKEYKKQILSFPLRQQLVATMMANEIVNRLGAAFIFDTMEKTGRSLIDVVRAYFIVHQLFELKSVWDEMEKLQSTVAADALIHAHFATWTMVRRTILWFLRSYPNKFDLQKTTEEFFSGFQELMPSIEDCLDEDSRCILDDNTQHFMSIGLPAAFAKKLGIIQSMATFPDIVLVARQTKASAAQVATLYYEIGDQLGMNWLKDAIDHIKAVDAHHREALRAISEDLFDFQGDITKSVIQYGKNKKIDFGEGGSQILEAWTSQNEAKLAKIRNHISKAQSLGAVDLAFVTLITRDIRKICAA